MRTLITIEDGKVSVQVDDQQPVQVIQTQPIFEIPKTDLEPLKQAVPTTGNTDVQMPADTVLIKPERAKPGGYPTPNRAPTQANKICEICEEPFVGHALSKTCSDACRKEKAKRYAANLYLKNHPKTEPDPPFTLDKPEEPAREPDIELRSRCCQAKVEPHVKPNGKTTYTCLGCGHQCGTHEYLPGHEKSAEELESWKPKVVTPGDPVYGSAPRNSLEENRQRKRV